MLEKFFTPKTVAVIGASRTPGKVGYAILQNLKQNFKGKIYPINPFASEILGLKAYPSVKDVPEKIDLAIIAVKPEIVLEVVKECKKAGIKNLIIISAGFSEVGEEEREKNLQKFVKQNKMRVIGPNCIGVFDAYSGLDTLFSDPKRSQKPRPGCVGFISQSGALGLALLNVYAAIGLGVSKFVSLGNKIDVDEIEMIRFFGKDKSIRVISLYLESTSDGKKFMKTCKEVAKEKPIVCLKAGRTEKGRKAVKSHTGALAGEYAVYSAAFKQCGVIEASDLEELIDFTKVLGIQPPMKGDKIAIVTNGGGCGIIATDQVENEGLQLAEFSKETLQKLKEILPPYAVASNPVDVTGDANSERYKEVLDVIFQDPNVDGVCVIALFQLAPLDEGIVEVLKDCKIYGKPFVVCSGGGSYASELVRRLQESGIPVYPTPHRAIKALSALWRYGKVLKKLQKKR
jgi:acetyl coenzyme A synthetase (ADP forming)-like protein